jgi:hypothetical protein
MKGTKWIWVIIAVCLLSMGKTMAQDVHFSQYYNAPMLVNAANTGLMSDDNYRMGANYRNQWAAVPVPYSSFSVFTDYQLFRKDTKNSWLAFGLAMFNDKAGDGSMSLLSAQGSMAYHIQMYSNRILSFGFYGAFVQRSVNFDYLTFDAQWDGFSFNKSLANKEQNGIASTSFADMGAGINYTYFPSDRMYLKIGGGVAHVNQPTEKFLTTGKNTVGFRPSVNVDGIFQTNKILSINPSFYYTYQSGANQIVVGSLFLLTAKEDENGKTKVILGAFERLNDAFIGAAGLEWGTMRMMASYDYTTSSLTPYNHGYGAFEISLIYQNKYSKGKSYYNKMNCPRF